MRALQRGCSLFFGTRPGRLFTLYAALPFGGAFIFLEAVHHMIEAASGLIHWIAGKIAVGGAVPADEGGPAIVVAADAATDAGGVGLLWVGIVGVVFFLLMHWPAFRRQAVEGARVALFKVPKAIAASPVVRALFHNRATRLFRRYVLTPLAVGGVAAIVARMVSGEWPVSLAVGAGVAAASALFLRTPVGRGLEDRLNEAAARAWRILSVNFVLGLLTWILHFFQAILEAIDRAIYAVDEWLRFREGQSPAVFAFKLVFGAVWFSIAYVFRFAWNLLVEPQINPIKHFPVVTVSHKMLLPLIPSLAKQFAADEKTVGLLVSGVPGIFGFLAWELRENWRLYRANAPAALRPVIIGSHGEKMRALLRPGFHSGIVPKSFAKLRKATATGKTRRATKLHHTLEHIAEAVHALVEREFVPYLESSRRWGGLPIHAGHALLATNRVRVPIHLGAGEAVISFEEAGGWVIASVAALGPLPSLSAEQRQAFADALTGLFKLVGVDAIREQASALFGPRGYNFGAVPAGLLLPVGDGPSQMFDYDDGPEIVRPARYLKPEEMVFSDCPLSWARWVSRWEADEAGKSPMDPLLPGWRVLP